MQEYVIDYVLIPLIKIGIIFNLCYLAVVGIAALMLSVA